MTPPTGQPSDADLARWEAEERRKHQPYSLVQLGGAAGCRRCGQLWPCEVLQVADAAEAAVRDRDARIAAARAEHQPTHVMWDGTRREVCRTCDHDDDVPVLWPCPTIAALDGPQ